MLGFFDIDSWDKLSKLNLIDRRLELITSSKINYSFTYMQMMTLSHSGLSLREVEVGDLSQILANDSDLVGLDDFVDRLESQLTQIPPESLFQENDYNCLILSFYFPFRQCKSSYSCC